MSPTLWQIKDIPFEIWRSKIGPASRAMFRPCFISKFIVSGFALDVEILVHGWVPHWLLPGPQQGPQPAQHSVPLAINTRKEEEAKQRQIVRQLLGKWLSILFLPWEIYKPCIFKWFPSILKLFHIYILNFYLLGVILFATYQQISLCRAGLSPFTMSTIVV